MNQIPSKVLGLQFSIMSPEEIRKGSVAEITSKDTFLNNKPIIGGIFDPRMGVLEPGFICPTDGLDYISSPGYGGHIELTRPVFYIQFLSTIMKILRCICFKCSKLLISKEIYKNLLQNMSNEKRWNHIFSLASKVKNCGDSTKDGCGCKQPMKIKKEGLATIVAEWKSITGAEEEETIVKLIPEMVLKIFKFISDDDISFMGFSSIFSRPEWMICQVLYVPPPAVRPSVKHDAQQRSEDDLSHIIVQIIKANHTLKEKISQDAPAPVIEDWETMLQYYVSTMVDNKLPGVASIAQRSGRPLKSIRERLNGKQGRIRGNLMGKRVDYSARSVITPDPNISIEDLGIPLKIAQNITKPITVNNKNKNELLKYIRNGPDLFPGAKMMEKKNGEKISLRYIDRDSITIENGDIVHRHMMDGDFVLFNRQPSLHRMSMMGHRAKILHTGATFRMNVADTKPYNADFDGDEMNLHMPQDIESEIELMHIAAVPWQIISPANNRSIVGIFQDSLLGAYRFTRPGLSFSKDEAMDLLMNCPGFDISILEHTKITSHTILSQIFPPLNIQSSQYNIKNGRFKSGQMNKSIFGSANKGILQRICNDYGNKIASKFIDNFQNIITDYMKTSSYSVGISDLIANKKTTRKIASVITSKKKDVQDLLDRSRLNIFSNKTGKTNNEELEQQVNTILNDAASQAGKIGKNSLDKDNKFVIMVNAGSKGSEINISQMISCLGQQNVDGKRIPYGFEDRTLPHFSKYDDSPLARGFVESSFYNGLAPHEVFFHAMGGRVGLIDTAVKTSETGYIQRRLIKGMEDIKVEYDMTVRNHLGKIVQYRYGMDSFDTVKIETQKLPIMFETDEDLYSHYNISTMDETVRDIFTDEALTRMEQQKSELDSINLKIIDFMKRMRNIYIEEVVKGANDENVNLPVSFKHLIDNIKNSPYRRNQDSIDITPLDVYNIIDDTYAQLNKLNYARPNELFKIMFYYHLSPRVILYNNRFNKKMLLLLCENIIIVYKKAIISPGEMVGIIAAQSIGEPTTQMTLNTFHFAGVASKSNVTRGVPRVEEILNLSDNPKNPSITIYLKNKYKYNVDKTLQIASMIEYTKLEDLVLNAEICFDPDDSNTYVAADKKLMSDFYNFEKLFTECNDSEYQQEINLSNWIIRIELEAKVMLEKNITMDDINFAITQSNQCCVSCVYSDYNSEKLVFRIRPNKISKKNSDTLDQSDEIYFIKQTLEFIMQNIIIRGIKDIERVRIRKIPSYLSFNTDRYESKSMWVLDTQGSNLLDILALEYIDQTKTITNKITEVYRVLGIEAARQSIYNEFSEVIESDGSYINAHHLGILADRMSYSHKLISIFRHGINNDEIGVIAKASFEETPEMFIKAARHAEVDTVTGVSSNIMCGQEGNYGTNTFRVYLDTDAYVKLNKTPIEKDDRNKILKEWGITDPKDPCGVASLAIETNCYSIKPIDMGQNDNDYNIF